MSSLLSVMHSNKYVVIEKRSWISSKFITCKENNNIPRQLEHMKLVLNTRYKWEEPASKNNYPEPDTAPHLKCLIIHMHICISVYVYFVCISYAFVWFYCTGTDSRRLSIKNSTRLFNSLLTSNIYKCLWSYLSIA